MSVRKVYRDKRDIRLPIRLLLVMALLSLGVLSYGVYLLNSRPPTPDSAMNKIIQAAVKRNRRYVIDADLDRRKVPNIAISPRAWDVLVAYSGELPLATMTITTTGDQMDLLSSEIRITCPSSMIECESDNGQVVSPRYFYVHTCTVVTTNH